MNWHANCWCLRILVLLGAAFAAPMPLAAENMWDGGGTDNNWSTGLNWSPDGAPANDGTAGIVFDGTVRLTPYVDTAWDVLSLTFNDPAGPFFIYGSPLTVGAGGIVNQDADAQSLQNDLILSAPQTWRPTAGDLRLFGNVANGGHLLTVDANYTTAVYGNITGSGGLVKSTGGILELRGVGPAWYTGPTTVTGGILSLLGITAWTAPFTVNSGAALSFGGGIHEFKAGATVSGAGAASFTAGMVTFNDTFNVTGAKTFSGGTVNFNGPVSGLGSTLTVSGGGVNFNSSPMTFTTGNLSGSGTLGGSAKVTVTGGLSWTSGTMSGTGLTEIPVGGTLSIGGASYTYKYLARTLNNSGTVTLESSGYGYGLWSTTGGSGTVINNLAGGMFDVQNNYGLSGTASAIFNNAGTFKKSAGTSTTSITSAWTFNNTGFFEVQTGAVSATGPFNNSGLVNIWPGRTLTLSGGGTSSGTFIVDSGATLGFSGGTHALAGTVAGTGTVSFSGGKVTFSNPYTFAGDTSFGGGTVNFNASVSGLGSSLTVSGGAVNFNSDPLVFTTVNLSGGGTLGGSAKVTITDRLDWVGGTMSGTGLTEIPVGGSLALSSTAPMYLGRTLNNSGTATLSGSGGVASTAGASTVFNNLAGATFDVQANYGLAGTVAATFNNAGTFKKSAGTGTTSISSAWTFNNTGTFEVQSGTVTAAGPFNNTGTVDVGAGRTLTLSGGGTSSGTFTVGSGGTLQFSGGTHTLNGGLQGPGGVSVTSGTVTLNGPVTGLDPMLTVSGGTINFNSNPLLFTTVNLSGGTLGGSANVTVTDGLSWTSGTMSGAGLTEIPVGGSLAFSGTSGKYLARTVNNSGPATLAGSNLSSAAGAAPVFNNLAAATFDVQADYGLAGTEAATFNNAGTFKKSVGTGTTSISSAWTFNNTGTFEVQSGTVTAAGPFNNTGTVDVRAGRTLTLSGGGTSSGGFVLGSGAALQLTGGEHAFNAGATISGAGSMTFSGGTWTGDGTVTVDTLSWTGGAMTGTGTTAIPAGGTLSIAGSSTKYLGRTLNNSGAATLTGSYSLPSTTGGSGAVINNLVGGLFDVQVNHGLDGTAPGVFNNVGTFRKSAGTSTTTIGSAWTFNNTGTFEVQSGTVTAAGPFNNTGTVNIWPGRTLTLSGGGASSGAFVLGSGAALQLTGGEHAFDAGATITGGAVTASGGTLRFDGTVLLSVPVTFSGGTWTGGGAVTAEALSWTGGTMTGTGTTEVPAGRSLSVSGSSVKALGRTINNAGTVTLASGGSGFSTMTDGSTPTINNLPSGIFDLQASLGGSASAILNNAGIFRKSVSASLSIDGAWTFNNTGIFQVQTGSLTLAGPFNNNGTVEAAAGTTLRLSGGGTSNGPFVLKSNAGLQFGGGDHVLNTGATVSGWGSVTVSDGTVTLNDLCNPTGGLTISGGTLNLNAPGGLAGVPIRLSGGTLVSNVALTNSSSVTGFGTIGGTGGFINNSSVLGSGGALVLSNSGPNVNAGTLGLGAGLQLVLAGGALTNTGSIDVSGGLIMGASALTNSVGGIISGTGMIQTPFSNAGGTLRSSTGTLNVQQAFSSAGLIEVQNGGGLTGGGITNAGVIQGSGSVANAIVNQGQIECTSGTLLLGGVVTNMASGTISAATGGKVVVAAVSPDNQGMISLDGGEIHFSEALVNAKTGRIAGRGRFLFGGGLTSSGQMQFAGGVADIFGTIGLVGGATGGKIINAGVENLITFFDDVTHNGAEIRTSAGNTTVFFGNVSGGGSFTGPGTVQFEGDYSPGGSPAAISFGGNLAFADGGNKWVAELFGADADRVDVTGTLTLGDDTALEFVFDAANPFQAGTYTLASYGTLAGTFSSVTGLGAYATGVNYGKGTNDAITVQVLVGLLPGDANLNAKVDGGDLAIWQQNYDPLGLNVNTFPMGDFNLDGKIDGGDLALWQQNYNPLGFKGSGLATAAVNPEPASLGLLGLGTAAILCRRRRI